MKAIDILKDRLENTKMELWWAEEHDKEQFWMNKIENLKEEIEDINKALFSLLINGVTLPIKEKIEFKYVKNDNKYIHRLTFDNIDGEAKIIDSEFIQIIED